MDLKLAGKTAFISGSTQGIGYAVAEQLLREGAAVVINGRTQEKVDAAVNRLRTVGAAVRGIAADFSDAAAVTKLIAQLPAIDILVNNVGIFDLKPFFELEDADWYRFFEVNVMSGARLSKALLPKMLERKWGRILFISSESGVNIPANMIHYGMSKTAMLSISRGLSQLTKGTAVTVNTILGGPTYSDGVAAAVAHVAGMQGVPVEQMKSQLTNPASLLDRFITPEEIAHFAAYLCSPLSVATNGAALRADGGVLQTIL